MNIWTRIIFLALLCFDIGWSDYSITVKLISFSDPSDTLQSGGHCDPFWWTGLDLCDIGLDLCIVPTQTVGLSFTNCNGNNYTTGDVTTNADIAIFNNNQDYSTWHNPTVSLIQGYSYRGAHIKVTAYDYDGGLYSAKDIIDQIDLILPPNANIGQVYTVEKIHGRPSGATSLQLTYRVNCANGYMGSDCSVAPTVFTTTPRYCPCPPGQVNGQNGTLSSPAYPLSYCSSMSCPSFIVAPPQYNIRITFVIFSLGTGDTLTIYEGRFGPILYQFHGTPASLRPIIISSNIATLVFTSDSANNGIGYSGSWIAYPRNQTPPPTPTLTSTSTIQPASSKMTTNTASLAQSTSPGTPLVCYNGGTAVANTVCQCNIHFSGPACESIVCQRGGTPAGNQCSCPPRSSGTYCENAARENCADLWTNYCVSNSGVQNVTIGGIQNHVYCDSRDGGGWTVIQKRPPGDSVNFNKTFSQYQNRFGSLTGSNSGFWMGLDTISAMTNANETMSLLVVLTDCNGGIFKEYYPTFKIGGASKNYVLSVSNGTGTPGDALNLKAPFNSMQNGMAFSAYDKDNDAIAMFNCGNQFGSGWWFAACGASNLNGPYVSGCNQTLTGAQNFWGNGILWTTEYPKTYSFYSAEMRIRPTSFVPNPQYNC